MQKPPVLILFVFIFFSINMNAQTIFPEGLKDAFINGNSEKISGYFGRNVELMLFDKGDVYSKAQAQLIISNFFSTYNPQSFIIESESKEENTYYTVALLNTQKEYFRIFIVYQANKKKIVVSQLVISQISEE